MKGVVLAGGLGKRLLPLTKITNKHLLPVYDRPMIYYPINKLVEAGIDQIMVVTGGNHAGEFERLLGNGSQFGLDNLRYAYQEGEDGIAAALALTREFVGNDKLCVILGDNIFADSIAARVRQFDKSNLGAFLFLKETQNPQRFGVAELDQDGNLLGIEEKPAHPKSSYAVTGIYMYEPSVFDLIAQLKPSARGEYEITDVSNHYIKAGRVEYEILEGWWTDAGTFESLHQAQMLTRAESMKRNSEAKKK